MKEVSFEIFKSIYDFVIESGEFISDDLNEAEMRQEWGNWNEEFKQMNKPNATEKIDDFAHLMTMEHFENCCKVGGFINADGFGFYAINGKMNSDKEILPSHVIRNEHDKRYTHVVWYNR